MNNQLSFTKEEQQLFFHAFTHASIGWALLKPNGDFIKINTSICNFLGYSMEELLAINFQQLTHPEDLQVLASNDERLIAGEIQSYQWETRYFHKKGHTIWGFLNVSVLLGESGQPPLFIAQIIDITKNKQVQQEANRFRSLYTSTSDGVVIFNKDATIIQVNPSFERMFGWSESEIIGKRLPVTPEFTLEDTVCLVEETIKGNVLSGIETVKQRKDGGLIPVSITMSPIYDHKGHISACAGVIRDITEQRAVTEKLLKSQELYRLISENAQDLITYSGLDGTLQFISPAVTNSLGYHAEDLIGGSVFQHWHPEDRASLANTGILRDADVDRITCRVQHKDGHYVWFETMVKLIRDEQGYKEKILGVGRDITEQKKKDHEIMAAKHKLESFIDYNLDPILIFDAEDSMIRVNDAFIKTYGWASEELLGLHVNDVPFVPLEKKQEVEKNKAAVKSGKGIMYETVRLKKDGTPLPVILSCFSMRNEMDNVDGWAAIIRDVTERKQAEELMLNSEKLSIAGQLAAGIAHEIRNPVTAIKGFLHLVQSGTIKQQYLDIMQSEIERIELILSELLILAKPQAIRFERKDIRMVLTQVVALLDAQANLNNVQIITEFDTMDAFLECDENQLKQVCINFINNAIDSMPHGGKLSIRLKRNVPDYLEICFIDEGCGIPRHILSKLGQPFYTTKEKGTGLGFMVSKRIIEIHKGNLEVFSEENKGTTIKVLLPASN